MRRTQIYLEEDQWRNLNIAKEIKHLTIAELIRQSIDKVYTKKENANFEKALDNITGLWVKRQDIGSTQEYLRSIRKERRIERLGL
ncbi:MAG: hypothetical protein ABH873_10240 [Candidatus Firestonebacteria bacterium]